MLHLRGGSPDTVRTSLGDIVLGGGPTAAAAVPEESQHHVELEFCLLHEQSCSAEHAGKKVYLVSLIVSLASEQDK